MDTTKIREAAGLLRSAWHKTNFCKGEAVCIMGSLAKAADPSLTDARDMIVWQYIAHGVLASDPRLLEIMEEEADAVFANLPVKTSRQRHFLDETKSMTSDAIARTALKVCLMNLTVMTSGEDAAEFLDCVADRHTQTV